MKRYLLLALALFAATASATDLRSWRNRSSGGKECAQVNVAGVMTDGLCVDASSGTVARVGIGTATPGTALDVVGLVQSSAGYNVNGNGSTLRMFGSSTAGNNANMGFPDETNTFGTASGQIQATGTTTLRRIAFLGAAGAQEVGSVLLTSGGWTLSATGAVGHLIENSSTAANTLLIRNNNTSTGTDAAADIIIRKGSATTTTAQHFIDFQVNNGTNSGYIGANGASTAAFQTASDRRLKENIVPIRGSLAKIMELKPVEFDYKAGGHQVGFVAQDMQKVFPADVGDRGDGMLTVAGWSHQMAHMVEAMQELKAENDALKARLDAAGL